MDKWIDQMVEVSRALDDPTTSAVYEDSPFYYYRLCRSNIEALVPPKPWIEEKIYRMAKRKAFVQRFFIGNESHEVSVSICDDPQRVASGFCSTHGLSEEYWSMVLELIEQGRDALRFHYRPLVFNVSLNHSPVQIRVYPGDDPSLLAERFCKERGLEGENCRMLDDHLRTKSFPGLLTYDSLCPKSTSALKKEIYRELVTVDDKLQMLEFFREDDPAQASERFLSQFSVATSGKENLMDFVKTKLAEPAWDPDRIDLLNYLIERYRYKSYLEIGVDKGHCFARIKTSERIGVDPASEFATHRITSDEFFMNNTRTFDLIFIDGLHHAEQVMKDVQNSLNFLEPGGTIVMHDCSPANEAEQRVPRETLTWTGDVWKTVAYLRTFANDIDLAVADFDHGCGIIQKRRNSAPLLWQGVKREQLQDFIWQDYLNYREALIRPLSPEALMSWLS